MIYQYFNINPIRIINQEILLLSGPKKGEADTTINTPRISPIAFKIVFMVNVFLCGVYMLVATNI